MVGAVAGLVCVAFRWLLERGEMVRTQGLEWLREEGLEWMWVPVIVTAASGGVAAWLVQRYAPEAGGSGIPQIKRVLAQMHPMRPVRIMLVKFFGGALAIVSGFALGREGPSVQLGGASGELLARAFHGHQYERKTLIIAGASAGLSAAFNAPFAGVVFAVEELRGELSGPIFAAVCAAAVAATAISRLMMGAAAVYAPGALGTPDVGLLPVFVLVGIGAGFGGVLFIKAVLAGVRFGGHIGRQRLAVRGVLAGAVTGLVAWWWPEIVGGGQHLANTLLHTAPVWWMIAAIFAARFVLTVVCYGSGVPGGIFAPMLLLGLLVGELTASAIAQLPWVPQADMRVCGLCGMGAYFTAVTRAPLTGIVLIIEMSGYYGIMPALLTAVLAAYMVAELLQATPIYEALGHYAARAAGSGNNECALRV